MLPFPKYKLADIASVCKKFYGRECDPSTLDLSYHIFDLIDTSLPFRLRHEKLTKWYEKALKNGDVPGSVMLVPTYNCESLEDVDKYFRRAIRVGYEGIMLRNWDSPYLLGWYDLRSTDLMKLKPCEDGEYEIAGCLEGNGKETGCIMFTCKTKEGLTFDVHPEGSLLGRRQQYSDFLSGKFDPIGKMYTIRYQELSKDKIPIHAVGVAVRDYE
jgi:DNA ligase-1